MQIKRGDLFYFKQITMKALTKIAELSVAYKLDSDISSLPIIGSSEDAYNFIFSFFPENTIGLQEHFIVCYLNRANKVVGVYHASTGGISGTVADPRLILGTALKVAASGLILAHNHPSGNLKPSTADQELTNKLVNASKMLDINLLDHLIVVPAHGEYFSFADQGIL
jgi:DNA repair protein RadC